VKKEFFLIEAIGNLLTSQNNKTILIQNLKQLQRKQKCIIQIVIGQITMLKHARSKEKKSPFL